MGNLKAFNVFARLDPPIWLLTCQAGPRRGGLIATFVHQASIVPSCPRVLVGVARHHFTWQLLQEKRSFVLHLLGEEHIDWVWRFGLHSGRDSDKLEGMDFVESATANPKLTGVHVWLDCQVEAEFSTGDRSLFLAEAVDAASAGEAPPLTLKRLLTLAPDEKKAQLKTQMERDRQIDRAAISAFRAGKPTEGDPSVK